MLSMIAPPYLYDMVKTMLSHEKASSIIENYESPKFL
jgi:hypothetical protein